jgi:hypothetical protein
MIKQAELYDLAQESFVVVLVSYLMWLITKALY